MCHLDFGRQRRYPLHVVSLQGLALCADSGVCYCRSVSYQICRDCELACLVLGNRTDKQNKLVCAICGVLGKIVAHIRINHIKDDVIVIGKKCYTLIVFQCCGIYPNPCAHAESLFQVLRTAGRNIADDLCNRHVLNLYIGFCWRINNLSLPFNRAPNFSNQDISHLLEFSLLSPDISFELLG